MPRTSGPTKDEQDPAWSRPDLREPRYSNSLERGLAILNCFTPKHPVLGNTDIAAKTGMNISTTHRYVTTLLQLGYLEQGANRKYRLGLRVTDLGMSALNSTSLQEHAKPYLEELRKLTGYGCSVNVLNGSEVLVIDFVPSLSQGQRLPDLTIRTASRLPVYCTAAGKLLLARLPKTEERELVAAMKLSKHGPNTISSKRALYAELDEIREDGYGTDDEELAAGLQAIAAPLLDETRQVVAAIELVVIGGGSFRAMVADLSPHVVSVASTISARLGYRREEAA